MAFPLRSFDDLRGLPGIFHLRQRRYIRSFLNGTFGTQWGQFPTAEAARAAVPKSAGSTYDDPGLVDLHADIFARIHLFDWPVLLYLSRLVTAYGATSLMDFGGHVGAKYYAFLDHLPLPPNFAWQVVELPAMVREGRARAAAANAAQLSFHERIEDAAPADILFCSGSIQYFDGTVVDILARMKRRPAVIIFTRLPVCADAAFYTLDNLRTAKVPFRIYSATENETLRTASGYALAERWHIGYRDFELPFSRPRRWINMLGEVWLDPAFARSFSLSGVPRDCTGTPSHAVAAPRRNGAIEEPMPHLAEIGRAYDLTHL